MMHEMNRTSGTFDGGPTITRTIGATTLPTIWAMA